MAQGERKHMGGGTGRNHKDAPERRLKKSKKQGSGGGSGSGGGGNEGGKPQNDPCLVDFMVELPTKPSLPAGTRLTLEDHNGTLWVCHKSLRLVALSSKLSDKIAKCMTKGFIYVGTVQKPEAGKINAKFIRTA